MSLFTQAEVKSKRLKMFIYGPSGSGKTVTSLNFPDVVCIDAEKGTDHYGKFFKFFRLQTRDLKTIHNAINELLENPGHFKTFVLDSFTVVYDSIVGDHEQKMKAKNGASYNLQPLDYKAIKSEVKRLVSKILALDMNIIVTSRIKPEYSKDKMMEVIGVKADSPDALLYEFDTTMELMVGEENKFLAKVVKDRTNTLPKGEWFDFSYQTFVKYVGIEDLEREAVVFNQKAALETNNNRKTSIKLDGKEVKTAGVSAENLKKLLKLAEKIGEDKMSEKLIADFGIESLLDLKDDESKLLIEDLK